MLRIFFLPTVLTVRRYIFDMLSGLSKSVLIVFLIFIFTKFRKNNCFYFILILKKIYFIQHLQVSCAGCPDTA